MVLLIRGLSTLLLWSATLLVSLSVAGAQEVNCMAQPPIDNDGNLVILLNGVAQLECESKANSSRGNWYLDNQFLASRNIMEIEYYEASNVLCTLITRYEICDRVIVRISPITTDLDGNRTRACTVLQLGTGIPPIIHTDCALEYFTIKITNNPTQDIPTASARNGSTPEPGSNERQTCICESASVVGGIWLGVVLDIIQIIGMLFISLMIAAIMMIQHIQGPPTPHDEQTSTVHGGPPTQHDEQTSTVHGGPPTQHDEQTSTAHDGPPTQHDEQTSTAHSGSPTQNGEQTSTAHHGPPTQHDEQTSTTHGGPPTQNGEQTSTAHHGPPTQHDEQTSTVHGGPPTQNGEQTSTAHHGPPTQHDEQTSTVHGGPPTQNGEQTSMAHRGLPTQNGEQPPYSEKPLQQQGEHNKTKFIQVREHTPNYRK